MFLVGHMLCSSVDRKTTAVDHGEDNSLHVSGRRLFGRGVLPGPCCRARQPQVKATLAGGMVDVTVLDDRTPPDILEHFVGVDNSMHGIGVHFSWCQGVI